MTKAMYYVACVITARVQSATSWTYDRSNQLELPTAVNLS